jgi:GrpB-like predicted nucleotidyltransferase (UPF0157 family)
MRTPKQYSDSKLASVTVGKRDEHNATIYLAEYNAHWATRYCEVEAIVKRVLGKRVMLIEHVGSTSIPGLSAKPIIDIVLEVPDSDREVDYVAALEDNGFRLRIREPDWHKHRLLKFDDVNLHVFSENCPETIRMLCFRDWLRSNPDEMERYLARKKELASRVWKYVQNYADAKSEVVEAILSRAMERETDA